MIGLITYVLNIRKEGGHEPKVVEVRLPHVPGIGQVYSLSDGSKVEIRGFAGTDGRILECIPYTPQTAQYNQ